MKKLSIFLVLLVISSLLFGSISKEPNDPKDKVLLTILKYVLTQGHYQPKDINDEFSSNVYHTFLESVDPSKRYFLASDIKEFSVYENQIDDQIKNEDLTFFFLVHDRLLQRINESENYYKDILEKPFDFNKEETLEVNYDNFTYANSKEELINNWRKQLKLNTLSRLHDKIELQEEKTKENSTYKKESFESLEKQSRELTKESMDDFFERVHELNYTDWFSTYINCISEEFDPHTSYLDPSLKTRFDEGMAGKLEGIGARLQKEKSYTKVSEIISGGPAWKQGDLEVGDYILKVAQGDDEPVDIVGMRLDDAIEYIKGKKGTEVKLTIKKVDGTLKVISIIRDVVEIEETFLKSSVITKDGRKFGIINLPKFYIDFDEDNYRNSATDMEQEIERLKEENVEGLVIDLRNNGGGSLQTAIEISGMFIEKGPVVQVKYRDRNPDIKYDKNSKIQWDKPLVILVNELSASASEIFAAAMQDYKRAVIIGGRQTYGKGTVQSVLDLNRYHNLNDDIGALKMTIQKFYRINGGSTQLEGVHSDIMLPDRYSYMEIGERDLDNALPYDKVPPAQYSLWNNYENFDEVVNNSKKRIANNQYFKLIDENAKWLKKSQDDTTIFLNYEAYKNDLAYHETESKKFNSIRDYTNNLVFESPAYEKETLHNNIDLKEKRDAWHKLLTKDIYVAEALNVLNELKLKPNYHIVKN